MTDFIQPLIYSLVGLIIFLFYGGHFTGKYIERHPEILQILKEVDEEKKKRKEKIWLKSIKIEEFLHQNQ